MSAYFEQLLGSANTTQPPAGPDPEPAPRDAAGQLTEVTEAQDAPLPPVAEHLAPERVIDRPRGPVAQVLSPAARPEPVCPVPPPKGVIVGPPAPAAAKPAELPEPRPLARAEPVPTSPSMTIREIVEWVAAAPAQPQPAGARWSIAAETAASLSATPEVPALPERSPAPVRSSEPAPSLEIERNRVVTVELAAPEPPQKSRPAAPVRAAPPSRNLTPEPIAGEADQLSVSIGAIHVVVEGPREPAPAPVAQAPAATLSSRLARRYLRPF